MCSLLTRASAGAVISVEGPEAATSFVVRALQRTALLGMSHDDLDQQIESGFLLTFEWVPC